VGVAGECEQSYGSSSGPPANSQILIYSRTGDCACAPPVPGQGGAGHADSGQFEMCSSCKYSIDRYIYSPSIFHLITIITIRSTRTVHGLWEICFVRFGDVWLSSVLSYLPPRRRPSSIIVLFSQNKLGFDCTTRSIATKSQN
jgi:hypothetical protein